MSIKILKIAGIFLNLIKEKQTCSFQRIKKKEWNIGKAETEWLCHRIVMIGIQQWNRLHRMYFKDEIVPLRTLNISLLFESCFDIDKIIFNISDYISSFITMMS